MTLTQGRFIAYEYDRMIVLFSMLDSEKEIACAISTSAMDELESVAGTRAGQREAQFMRLRDRIKPPSKAPTHSIAQASATVPRTLAAELTSKEAAHERQHRQ